MKSVDKVETVQRLLVCFTRGVQDQYNVILFVTRCVQGELIKQSFGQEPFMLLVDVRVTCSAARRKCEILIPLYRMYINSAGRACSC